MRIQFFDDLVHDLKPRDKVRFNRIGLYVYEDRRRVAVGFDITPFAEEPSIYVVIFNDDGEVVTSLNIVNANQTQFTVTMHLRAEPSSHDHQVEAVLYYLGEEGERIVVDKIERELDLSRSGEQLG